MGNLLEQKLLSFPENNLSLDCSFQLASPAQPCSCLSLPQARLAWHTRLGWAWIGLLPRGAKSTGCLLYLLSRWPENFWMLWAIVPYVLFVLLFSCCSFCEGPDLDTDLSGVCYVQAFDPTLFKRPARVERFEGRLGRSHVSKSMQVPSTNHLIAMWFSCVLGPLTNHPVS